MVIVSASKRGSRKPASTIPAVPPLDLVQRYTINEACLYLRTSHATLYKMMNAEQIIVIREGGRTFIPGKEIARLSGTEKSSPEISAEVVSRLASMEESISRIETILLGVAGRIK
jgi:hypothetical protein